MNAPFERRRDGDRERGQEWRFVSDELRPKRS
jgi:hypothetical protein